MIIKDLSYRVKWQYQGLLSICIIETIPGEGVEPVIMAKASIKRYYKDLENRKIARFKTLTEATKQLPKEERYSVWESYRLLRHIPAWANECKPKVSHSH